MGSLDDEMRNLEEKEGREQGLGQENKSGSGRVSIGTVEHFFDKVSVAAITLTGSLRIGDTIEIESQEGTVRLRVESMQIDRRDVSAASQGDSVGIRVDARVPRGSQVYRLV